MNEIQTIALTLIMLIQTIGIFLYIRDRKKLKDIAYSAFLICKNTNPWPKK